MTGQEIIDYIKQEKMENVNVSVQTSYKGNAGIVLEIESLGVECTELNMFICVEDLDQFVENQNDI